TGERLLVACDGRLDLPLSAVRRRVLAWSSCPAVLGMQDELRWHAEPLGALLELLGEGRLRIGLTGEALVAHMPQRLLPRFARGVHLPLPRRPRTLLALRRTDDHPALPRGRLGRRRPAQRALLLPGEISHRERGARVLGRLGHAAAPAHARGAEPRDDVGTGEPAVGHEAGRVVLGGRTELVRERLHGGEQADLVTGIPLE